MKDKSEVASDTLATRISNHVRGCDQRSKTDQ